MNKRTFIIIIMCTYRTSLQEMPKHAITQHQAPGGIKVPTVFQHRQPFGQQDPSELPLQEHTRSPIVRGTSSSKKAVSAFSKRRPTPLKTAPQLAIFKQRLSGRGVRASQRTLPILERQAPKLPGSAHSFHQQELFESPSHKHARFWAARSSSSSKKAAAAPSKPEPINSGQHRN